VSEVHQIHNAEDEREPSREQKQQQPELQTVQALFDKQQHRISATDDERTVSAVILLSL
jgi:hypothetical protein